MAIDHKKAKQMADAYTAAWNSGSAQAVAEFYAKDGGIVINGGEPWQGRDRVARSGDVFKEMEFAAPSKPGGSVNCARGG